MCIRVVGTMWTDVIVYWSNESNVSFEALLQDAYVSSLSTTCPTKYFLTLPLFYLIVTYSPDTTVVTLPPPVQPAASEPKLTVIATISGADLSMKWRTCTFPCNLTILSFQSGMRPKVAVTPDVIDWVISQHPDDVIEPFNGARLARLKSPGPLNGFANPEGSMLKLKGLVNKG